MKLKICEKCGAYTLKKEHCNQKTKSAGYKFIKRNQKSRNSSRLPALLSGGLFGILG